MISRNVIFPHLNAGASPIRIDLGNEYRPRHVDSHPVRSDEREGDKPDNFNYLDNRHFHLLPPQKALKPPLARPAGEPGRGFDDGNLPVILQRIRNDLLNIKRKDSFFLYDLHPNEPPIIDRPIDFDDLINLRKPDPGLHQRVGHFDEYQFDGIGDFNRNKISSISPVVVHPVSDPRPDADGRIRIRGMLIPEGFTPIKMWQEANPGLEPDAAHIRYLYIPNHNLLDPKSYYGEVFVVDPENTEWQATLGQYKRNTKTLERLLQDRLDEADIPLWVRNTRRPSRAHDFRRVRMILCPTPFSSDVEGVDRIMQRNQPKDGADDIMIHTDEAGKLCLVRRYTIADNAQSYKFRIFVAQSIYQQKSQIEAAHGDMTKIADILFRILVDGYETSYKTKNQEQEEFDSLFRTYLELHRVFDK